MSYTVHFEYSDSNCWDTDVGEPAHVTSLREARQLAMEHFEKPTSNSQTRVRIVGKTRSLELTDYGHSEGEY